MGKNIGYYPKGYINQHKSMATGAGLQKPNTKDCDPSGWGKGQSAVQGRTNIKSGTSTGKGGGGKTPNSTFTNA